MVCTKFFQVILLYYKICKLRLQLTDQSEVGTPREDNNATQSTNSRSRSRGRVYTARARSSSTQRGATYVRSPPTPSCLRWRRSRYAIIFYNAKTGRHTENNEWRKWFSS